MNKFIKILSVILGVVTLGIIGALVYFSATEEAPPSPQASTLPPPPMSIRTKEEPPTETPDNPYKQPDIKLAPTGNPTIDAQNQQILDNIKAQNEAVERMAADMNKKTQEYKKETEEIRNRIFGSKCAFFAADVASYADVKFDVLKRDLYILPIGAAAKSFKDYTGKNKEDWDALKEAIYASMDDMAADDFRDVAYCVYYPDGSKIYRAYVDGEVAYEDGKEE